MLKGRMTRRRFLATTRRRDGGGDAVCARRPRRRQAVDRLLGPLGARRQQRHDGAGQGVGGEGEGRGLDRLHHLVRATRTCSPSPPRRRRSPGHDILAFPTWEPQAHAEQLEPVDDIMAELIKQNGAVNADGRVPRQARTASGSRVPATVGSQIKGPCSRIDLMKQHAGIDVQAMYPAGGAAQGRGLDARRHLKAAEACHKAGFPSASGSARPTDNGRHVGRDLPVLRRQAGRRQGQHHGQDRRGAPGARLLQEARAVPAAGRAGLGRRLQQQVAGLRQGRADHEPAERLGGRQARCAADRRAAAGRTACPSGPKGRYAPFLPYFWGIWNFSKNKSAAKSLLVHLSQRAVGREDGGGERRLRPALVREASPTFKTWAEEGPPKGTLYHYPNPHNHQILSIAAAPAPPQDRRSRSTPRRSRPRWSCAHCQGRSDGEDARLGRERARRLHAHLTGASASDGRSRDPPAPARRLLRSRSASSTDDRLHAELSMADIAARGTGHRQRAASAQQPAQAHAAQIDHRVPDGAAADPADRAAGALSGVLRRSISPP